MAWPPHSGGPRSVDTQVLTLRRKLEQAGLGREGGVVQTVRQQGYRFSLDDLNRQTLETDLHKSVRTRGLDSASVAGEHGVDPEHASGSAMALDRDGNTPASDLP